MTTVHLLIKGKVQGVFYRASAKEAAERLHITGWVKNTPEGYVEVFAQGEDGDLRQFVEWCRKGPDQAVVSEVVELDRRSASPGGIALKGFAIVR
jgi:acylphosphatase